MSPRAGWRNSTRKVPHSDLENKTLGVGDPNSADRSAGKHRAVWSKVNLSGLGAGPVAEVDVPHTLGVVPKVCELKGYTNHASAGTFIVASEARRENWSHSHVHMSLRLLSGSFVGCAADFLVSGG